MTQSRFQMQGAAPGQDVKNWQRFNTMLGRILIYDVLLEYEPEDYQLMHVEFVDNFGPWKNRQKVDIIKIDYEGGFMREYNLKGDLVNETRIKLVAGN